MTNFVNYLPQVRGQYEEFPYPERNPEDEKRIFRLALTGRMDAVSHHLFRGRQDFKNFRVLVAGGGTGDAAICWGEQLRYFEGCEVIYLDMSTASMEIAQKRAAIRKLDNIKFVNESLLNASRLGLGQFDMINCIGVLHHLEDPDAGLKALQAVLKPAGAMDIMVYAPYGRTGIYQMQALMRLINHSEFNQRKRLDNTKTILKTLTPHHWLNVQKQLGYSILDMDSDAGIYDSFLHEQDRAYTILEVHEWLERCGLQMQGEPGTQYMQTHYLPETFIKDDALLRKIEEYPLKIRQAIGEAVSTRLSTHTFYAVNIGASNSAANLTDPAMIPWSMTASTALFRKLADIADEKQDNFALTFQTLPGKPSINVPKGKYIASLLRQIDGQQTVERIVQKVQRDPKFKVSRPSVHEIMTDFEALFLKLNRGHILYLRHSSISAYPLLEEIQIRVKKIFAME